MAKKKRARRRNAETPYWVKFGLVATGLIAFLMYVKKNSSALPSPER
jgi:hypothetical protein